jgi:hypothetical protein
VRSPVTLNPSSHWRCQLWKVGRLISY